MNASAGMIVVNTLGVDDLSKDNCSKERYNWVVRECCVLCVWKSVRYLSARKGSLVLKPIVFCVKSDPAFAQPFWLYLGWETAYKVRRIKYHSAVEKCRLLPCSMLVSCLCLIIIIAQARQAKMESLLTTESLISKPSMWKDYPNLGLMNPMLLIWTVAILRSILSCDIQVYSDNGFQRCYY